MVEPVSLVLLVLRGPLDNLASLVPAEQMAYEAWTDSLGFLVQLVYPATLVSLGKVVHLDWPAFKARMDFLVFQEEMVCLVFVDSLVIKVLLAYLEDLEQVLSSH